MFVKCLHFRKKERFCNPLHHGHGVNAAPQTGCSSLVSALTTTVPDWSARYGAWSQDHYGYFFFPGHFNKLTWVIFYIPAAWQHCKIKVLKTTPAVFYYQATPQWRITWNDSTTVFLSGTFDSPLSNSTKLRVPPCAFQPDGAILTLLCKVDMDKISCTWTFECARVCVSH